MPQTEGIILPHNQIASPTGKKSNCNEILLGVSLSRPKEEGTDVPEVKTRFMRVSNGYKDLQVICLFLFLLSV